MKLRGGTLRTMKLSTALARLCAFVSLIVVCGAASAQQPRSAASAYPDKHIRLISPYAAGGGNSLMAHLIGGKLTEAWGPQVIVDSRPGGNTIIGTSAAARATPDGYTLLLAGSSHVIVPLAMDAPYDPVRDFAAIGTIAKYEQILVVTPSLPAKTLKEFIALAKSKPHVLTYGSAGVGTQTHLAAENFLYAAGIDLIHIPYKGEAPAVVDLMGGQIFMVTPNLSAAIAFVQQGKLHALAVTSRQRSKQLPNVPSASETLPGFENLGWFGFMVPAATPKPLIDRIYQDTAKVLQASDIRTRFEQLGMAPVGNAPADFAKAITEESARWAKIIRERKLQVE
jgi:tripartite-type tricarboxylate transporter receptor subunit TctC